MKPFNPECWYRQVCDDYSEECQIHCAKYIKMKYLMEHSGIPTNKCKPIPLYPQECDREAFERLADIKSDIVSFVDEGRNLYITSYNVGNGKSSWAIKILLKYFESTWSENGFDIRGIFVHVPTFLMKCKDFKTVDTEFEELKRNLMTADLVIWDDIASTDISSFDLSQLSMYVDARVLNDLANIYTGNLPTRELLESALGTRLTSRMYNSSTEVVELVGGDRR